MASANDGSPQSEESRRLGAFLDELDADFGPVPSELVDVFDRSWPQAPRDTRN